MSRHLSPPLARFAHALRPARLSTQGRVLGAALLVMLTVFVLAGQQALHIVRQDADAALRVQATAQLAALSQAVADPAIWQDYLAVRTRLRIPIDQGNLQHVEYVAPDGRVIREQASPPTVDRPDWFARLSWEAGLPPIRLHDVRHSYATAALRAGVPVKVVSERLGHASVTITLDVYGHVIPGQQGQAAAKFAAVVGDL